VLVRRLYIVLVLAIVGCTSGFVEISGETFDVEIADSAGERQRGLMHREELCVHCGMLFVFDEEKALSFWMKNTLIPLDMVFIGEDMSVVDVLHAVPCVEEICPSYVSEGKYVLEVNGNMFDDGIVGQKIKIQS